jgi:Holliday junction DNA helicase RuvA
MIAFLRGEIKYKGSGFVIIVVNDVGYRVGVNETHLSELVIGDETELFIHHHVREDAVALYGFSSMDQLEMFELLLSVSGIGPKSALGVLAAGEVQTIRDSIASGDYSMLTKVSGIGKKTAERVVMELRDKVASLRFEAGAAGASSFSSNADEIDALMALGYSMQQAREALQKVDPSVIGSGERIREALKRI